MKKMVLVLTLAVFALSGSAFAQDPGYSNNIGLYLTPEGHLDPTAEDGTGSCGSVAVDTPVSAFLVLSKLSHGDMFGWEAKIAPDNLLQLSFTAYGDHIDAGTRPNEHIVGLASPLPVSGGAVVVAEAQYMVSSALNDPGMPSQVFISGVYFSTIKPINGPPAYLEASGSQGIALHNVFGDPFNPNDDIPALILNGDCTVVSVEDATWGGVKSLYR